jgi:hypothetical protein
MSIYYCANILFVEKETETVYINKAGINNRPFMLILSLKFIAQQRKQHCKASVFHFPKNSGTSHHQ